MNQKRLLWAIFLVALTLRLGAALHLGERFYFIDETNYVDTVRALLAGNGFPANFTKEPGYPVLLTAIAAPLPKSILALRVGQSLVAAAGSLLVFVFVEGLFGFVPALIAVACYALDPLNVVAGALLYPEALASILLVATLMATKEAVRGNGLAWSALSGLLLGLLAQTRGVGLVLVPVLATWIALALRAVHLRRRAAHAAVLLITCLAALVPWTYRNYEVYGGFVLISRSAHHNAPHPLRVSGESEGVLAATAEKSLEAPGVVARRVASEFLRFWELYPTRLVVDRPDLRMRMHAKDERLPVDAPFLPSLRDQVSALSFAPELFLAVFGIAVAWKRRSPEAALLAVVLIAYALGYSLFISKLRYRITVLPTLFAFTGLGLATLLDLIPSVRRRAAAFRSTEPPAPLATARGSRRKEAQAPTP